MYLVIPR